ncbi:TonB-dependent receptor [Pedobacter metabolipauper]|nr:TonB-dependent receptor [Pedobacter metabolipauper]
MKKSLLLSIALMLVSFGLFAQTIIKGKVVDGVTGETLPGASVILKGTKFAVLTSLDGSFTLKINENGQGTLAISYIGFITKEVSVSKAGGTENLGTIELASNSQSMSEVVISAGLAIDRKTPVAVSTIRAADIEARAGNNEFPELLKRTPSTYVTKGSGGFGDSRINVRGFDTKNTAVMVNGVPVNDMEGGTVYWSNWAGLSDVANSIQVQRGLGASKLSTGSVGGTINIVTKPTEIEKGGSFKQVLGNDGYFKNVLSYSTGKMANGLAFSFLGSRTVGNGYIDGTEFEGWNYFLAAGYQINDKHTLTFSATGAPQWHHQNSNTTPYQSYYGNPLNKGVTPRGEKYNANWGTLGGEEYNMSKNYYHKPVINLNHYWKLNDKTNINSVVYASFGRGGGTGANGGIGTRNVYTLPRTADSLIRYDDIRKYNAGGVVTDFASGVAKAPEATGPYAGQYVNASGTSTGITRRSSVNSHNWFGAIVNLTHKLTDNFTLSGGLDWRYYKGLHYRSVDDLLGASAYRDTNNDFENPSFAVTDEDHLDYDYNGYVNQIGGYVSAEYSDDIIDAFVSGTLNNTGYSRETMFFNGSNGTQKSKTYNYGAYSTKGGINVKVTENHNFFGNAGYFTRAPFYDTVFPNRNGATRAVENSTSSNEKILGFELGYGLRTAFVNASLNVYRTEWNDRSYRRAITLPDATPGSANINGINALHKGIELEVSARPTSNLELTAMVSVGDWKYKNDVNATSYNDDGTILAETKLYLKDVKIGDAAQTTANFGASYQVVKGLRIRADYFMADDLYASFLPENRSTAPAAGEPNRQAWKLPSYQLLDGGLSYNFKLQGLSTTISLGVDNILNKSYISEAYTDVLYNTSVFNATTNPLGNGPYDFVIPGTKNASGTRNNVSIGFGRTWNAGLSIKF